MISDLSAGATVIRRCRDALLAFALSWGSAAWADLLVYPTRLVLDGNTRAAQVELLNNGKEPATYRIQFVNKRMTETGGFVDVASPAPGEQFADSMLRHSPRQVTLSPGASQTIRVALRKPAELSDGEYRSHLTFDPVPDAASNNVANAAKAVTPGGLGVQLQVLIGVSIPVIVRHGTTNANVSISDLKFGPAVAGRPASLAFAIQRTGNRSVYGDLGLTFTPRGGAEQQVAKAGGMAVYTPNPLRRGQLELHPPAGLALANGTLRLTYREPPEQGGKLLAEAVLALP